MSYPDPRNISHFVFRLLISSWDIHAELCLEVSWAAIAIALGMRLSRWVDEQKGSAVGGMWGQAVELFPWFLQRRKINLKNICGMWKERKKLFFYLLLLLFGSAMFPNDYQTKFHLGHWGLPFLINGAVVRTGILSKLIKMIARREQIKLKLNQLRSHLFKLSSSSSASSPFFSAKSESHKMLPPFSILYLSLSYLPFLP